MSIFNHTTKGQNDVREEMLKGYRPPMAAVKAKVSK
jgi:hypothetical protein